MTCETATTPTSIPLNTKFDIPVELHFVGGPPEGIDAKIYRVSAGLIELTSPVYVPQNQKVEMVCQKRRMELRVAYCRRRVSAVYDLAIRMASDAYLRR